MKKPIVSQDLLSEAPTARNLPFETFFRRALTNLKLSLWIGFAGGSSLPLRAELHRGLVARSVRSGKSADVSFTFDISGKRQRGRGPR